MYVSFVDMLNCPSVAARFKKYDIFLSAEMHPIGTVPRVQWLGEGLKNKNKTNVEKEWAGFFNCFQNHTWIYWHEVSCLLTWR